MPRPYADSQIHHYNPRRKKAPQYIAEASRPLLIKSELCFHRLVRKPQRAQSETVPRSFRLSGQNCVGTPCQRQPCFTGGIFLPSFRLFLQEKSRFARPDVICPTMHCFGASRTARAASNALNTLFYGGFLMRLCMCRVLVYLPILAGLFSNSSKLSAA